MDTLKFFPGYGDDVPSIRNAYGNSYDFPIRVMQAGSCCGAMVLYQFSTKMDLSRKNRHALLSKALHGLILNALGEVPLNPEDYDTGEEEYDEDNGQYIITYPDDVVTVPMQPAIVTAYLANKQIELWHDTLIEHGFILSVEGATNSKSRGGYINMYVGITPTSEAYGEALGRKPVSMAPGLTRRTTDEDDDEHLQKEPA